MKHVRYVDETIASPVVVATAAQIARRVRERTRSSGYRYADRRVAARKAPEIPRPSLARPTVRIAGTIRTLFRIILPFRPQIHSLFLFLSAP